MEKFKTRMFYEDDIKNASFFLNECDKQIQNARISLEKVSEDEISIRQRYAYIINVWREEKERLYKSIDKLFENMIQGDYKIDKIELNIHEYIKDKFEFYKVFIK